MKVQLVASDFGNVVREVDEQLGQAALGCGIVAENRREGGVAEGLG